MDLSGEGTEADMTIAVMGMTGVGKSTFIRHCLDASSAAQPIIGHDIESCTQDVEVYQCQYGMDRQYTVDLVDTPGFDDTHRSDREVLEAISLWLTTSGRYQSNRKLHGIIYLHRISDVRMQGSALNNLRMFKKLCGPEAFHRILLTTTMWEQVLPEDGSRRLSQLETADDFWAPMIRKGSRVVQHLNTPDSAKKLIGLFLDKPNAAGQSQLPTSIILDIQTELLKKDATLMQTGAGRELDGNLAAAQIKVETEVETIKADIRDAEAECDDDDAEYLRKQIPTLMRKIEELQADREGLHVSFKEVMELERRRQDKASEMQKNLQEERSRTAELRRNTEDLRLKHEGEMARLRKQLQGTQIDRTQTTEVASPNLATWTRQIKLQNLHTTSFKVFGDAFFFQASNSCIWSVSLGF
ncbi:hypothetical protein PFICI_05458 [Pestalotiopsis fici W106-1]|uniref:G domain-containing protein n=1 Tax=Pestalotiopsis fici (strain W106-1 / CGMCC3.15140) TaxID=1229662 RepID=W3XDT0_PESFW|nr:uncharacterized protein PFICI_05458 [Pestalotiopsis fici W106-1]ETS83582.1 hypothetical protein PFICI_05458 [Pestalotiopsis fici W106-1]